MDVTCESNLYQAYEKRQQDATRPRPILPVTIITGSLGAGKTTLMRKILRTKHNLRIAAVVNEYGSVDHDGGVLERDGFTDGVEKLSGGCVCCQGSLGDDLEDKVGELLRRPDHADDRYDYLVIETSGVSDPESIVRALDKTFGKLTRARLDSVVTVVDTDALLHQLGENGQGGGMMVSSKRQLESADVVLLNKADLISTAGMATVTAAVLAVNPSARIESCSYGKVPIHAVLDVEAPRTDIQGVSHERIKTHLHVSSKGGNLRKALLPSSKNGGGGNTASSSSSGHSKPCTEDGKELHGGGNGGEGGGVARLPHGHLRDDGLEQVTFTSTLPLSLARFQDWVCYGMPAGVVRVKGILAFDEDRLTRSVFNMSGRRRLAFESDGKWEGPMSLYLVVIGVGMDLPGISAALEGMRVESSVSRMNVSGLDKSSNNKEKEQEEVRRLTELLAEDPMFDALPRETEPTCPPNVVRFRFTGQGVYGIPPAQLCLKFGVNLDAINRSILRAVNSNNRGTPTSPNSGNSGTPANTATTTTTTTTTTDPTNKKMRVFLTSQEGVNVSGNGGGEGAVLRYAVGGTVSLVETWPGVIETARGVMKTELGHVHFCSCFS